MKKTLANWHFFIFGLFIVFIEPIIYLLSGDDIGGALWPHAYRTLIWTGILRDYNKMVFVILLLSTAISFLLMKRESLWKTRISLALLGSLFALVTIFFLLDMAYFRGGFLLLPTVYGFMLLILILNSIKEIKINLNLAGIIFAVWLISPGLSAISGLAPSPPPSEDVKLGEFEFSTSIHPYPMPIEVENIRGDIEADIVFSIYLTKPTNPSGEMPLAILIHGFANPGFSTYEDWAAQLASRGMMVAFIQYPSDVTPPGWDTYSLVEQNGMSNHPFHLPRAQALEAAINYLPSILDSEVNTDHLYIGGHSLGAGYALLVMDQTIEMGWANSSLVIDLEQPYARPVQDHLQINSSVPNNFIAHIAISEDDMSVNDCFGVAHQKLLGSSALLMQIPSDRYGFPRLVASHYLPAAETHDTLADWGFYRRVGHQADWIIAQANLDTQSIDESYLRLIDSDDFRDMGEWSDGTPVNEITTWAEAINSPEFEHCQTWVGP